MIVFRNKLVGLILLALLSSSAAAFSSKDEQIGHYLNLLSGSNVPAKIKMLERLQWSGLTDARFYDVIDSIVIKQSVNEDIGANAFKVLGHQVRALGFSGNEKYLPTLEQVKKNAIERKIRSYAKKALRDMKRFSVWNKLVAESELVVEGKPVEIVTYMKMLSVDNPSVQKLAARAIFHEQQKDVDLLTLTAEKLKSMYLKDGLGREEQDTAAWFCKAIGQNGGDEFIALLVDVVDKTPYSKIKKHASKFVP